jgi:hypothetical protein
MSVLLKKSTDFWFFNILLTHRTEYLHIFVLLKTINRLKLNKLLKFVFVFLVLAALLKLQYYASLPVETDRMEYSAGSFQPYSPSDNSSNAERPYSSKDLIRLEIFFMLLFLLTYFNFSFHVFEFVGLKISIPEKALPVSCFLRKQKNRAPPFLSSVL